MPHEPPTATPDDKSPPRTIRRVAVAILKRPFNRQGLKPAAVYAVARSFLSQGQKDPLHLGPADVVLAGNVRTEAALALYREGHAEWEYLNAVDYPELVTYQQQLRHVLSCDQKSNRTPLDTCLLLIDAREKLGLETGRDLAAAVGLSEATVSRALRAFRYGDQVREAVMAGRLSFHHVTAAGKLPPARAVELLLNAAAEGQPVHEMLRPFRGKRAATDTYRCGPLTYTAPRAITVDELAAALEAARNQVVAGKKTVAAGGLPAASVLGGKA